VTAAIVVAAGRSERFGGPLSKILVPWRGRTLIAATLDAFDSCPEVSSIVLVLSEAAEDGWRAAGRPGRKVNAVARGGTTRQESVGAGFAAVASDVDIVLVHDGARAFVSPGLIARVVAAAARSGAAVPVLPITDTVKRVFNEGETAIVGGTLERSTLGLAQTPQGFRIEVLRGARAHAIATGLEATDDVALVEAAMIAGALPSGIRVEAVPGEVTNVKVTRPEDLQRHGAPSRIGLGHDVHPLAPGRPFRLAGVDVWEDEPETETFGPVGHSDGDALSHAICDALLSAAGLPDIGAHFPDTIADNAGRSSLEFLSEVASRVAVGGWRIVNVSAVLHLERPKLAPRAVRIRQAVADSLGISIEAVGLSAKRGEGLGDVGTCRAVRCDAVALLEQA
jgi:2-C-methyl-D-erythritol 4-phosphate cytidylyltransferase/2-C-methyl-D-erythritol 2,4-cyclodiphosphate synthase